METYAFILNRQGGILIDSHTVHTQDEVDELRKKAQEFADSGTPCQAHLGKKYLTPNGVNNKSYTFHKAEVKAQSAQSRDKGGRVRTIYIYDADWAKAVELGDGNGSAGIRLAISKATVESKQQSALPDWMATVG
jgi:hypothetical protein